MTGVTTGLLLGLGLMLIWRSCWNEPAAERGPGRWSPLMRDRLAQAGIESISPSALLTASLVLGAAVGALVLGVSQAAPIAGAFALLATAGPWVLVSHRARRRRAVLREIWPDVVDNLASGVRAGLSLPEALAQIAVRGPEPLRPAFAAFAKDYAVGGRFAECLDLLKERLADPVADRLCEALRITREVGGSDLGRLLRSLSSFLREDSRARSELQARQSWTVNAARLAVAAPWVVLALLATRPEAVAAYNTPAGVVVLAVGAGSSLIAYRLMIRIGRLPEEVRVLR